MLYPIPYFLGSYLPVAPLVLHPHHSVNYYYYYYYFFVDYSMYVIKICFVSYFLASQSYLDAKIKIRRLFLSLNKVLKRKKGTRLVADISLPYCLATGIGNLALKAFTGPKSRGILLGMTLC